MRSGVAFCVSSLLYSHVYLYLYNKNIIDIIPGISFLTLVLLGSTSYILYLTTSNKKKERLHFTQLKSQKKLFYWFVLYCIAILFSYLFSDSNEHTLRAFKTFIVLSTLFLTFFLTFNNASTIRAGFFGVIFVIILSVINNYIDFILSDVTVFSESPGRAAGLFVNPNIAGLKLVAGMIITVKLIPERYRLVYCLFVGSAVLITFSRSSILAWLISLSCLSYLKIFNIHRVVTVSFSILLLVILALIQSGQYSVSKQLSSSLSEDASQRIVYKSDDSSVSARLYSAKRALDLFIKSPTFGHGLGSHLAPATRVGPHNQYLIIAVEQGIIGIFLYISLLFLIWHMNSDIAKIFIISLCFFSFFDHNILDFPSTWLSIYLAAIATTKSKKVRTSTKTKRATAIHIPQPRLRRTL